ncbi:MAG: DNA cytosine methyltransferase [Bacteroidales bacterium]
MTYKIPTLKEIKDQTENGNHKFEVVSFFAGGGGSSTGYRMAGGKVLAVNEFIEEAQKTYAENYPATYIFKGDIKKLTPEDVLEKINKNKFELDVMDGSPPCSAFSTIGKRDKGWGKDKKYSDSSQENVEDLFFEYIRILRGIMPKVFIAENVAGLSIGVAKGYLNEILRELKTSDYHVECKILNAKWLGVPQSRNRIIFVGVRNDLMKKEYVGNLHPKPLKNIVTLKEAFDGLVFTEQDANETCLKKYSIYKLLIGLKKGDRHKKRFTLMKANPNDVGQCITAFSAYLGAGNPYHWDNRAFTVDEVKRIMSIPDDYILTGKYQKKVERLGRMVAPFMMRSVCENLLKIGVISGNTKKLDI